MHRKVTSTKSILYVITKGTWGGACANVYDLLVEAKAKGWRVGLAYGAHGLLAEKAQELGVELFQIQTLVRDISLTDEYKTLKTLRNIIKTFSPDVVHLHSSKVGAVGSLAARLAGAPHIIFTAHAWAFTEDRSLPYKLFFLASHYLTTLLCHHTVLVSHKLKSFTTKWPFVQRKLTVIHNGVAPSPLFSREDARAFITTKAPNAFSKSNAVVTIAELHHNKGLDMAIEAWKKLPASVKEIATYTIIGAGEKEMEYKQLAKSEPNIAFTGFIDNAKQYLQAFDLFLLPSRTEALGYVLLEAGLAHLPVIATSVGGVPEIVAHEKTGLLIKSETIDELSEALAILLTHPSDCARYAQNLNSAVTTHFNIKTMLDKTFALYDK
jgi:glycosyltransferase involved in cell wall biosynthesis